MHRCWGTSRMVTFSWWIDSHHCIGPACRRTELVVLGGVFAIRLVCLCIYISLYLYSFFVLKYSNRNSCVSQIIVCTQLRHFYMALSFLQMHMHMILKQTQVCWSFFFLIFFPHWASTIQNRPKLSISLSLLSRFLQVFLGCPCCWVFSVSSDIHCLTSLFYAVYNVL